VRDGSWATSAMKICEGLAFQMELACGGSPEQFAGFAGAGCFRKGAFKALRKTIIDLHESTAARLVVGVRRRLSDRKWAFERQRSGKTPSRVAAGLAREPHETRKSEQELRPAAVY